MVWQLGAVNVTKTNSQNSFDMDMCIKEAQIVFEHYNIEKVVFGAYEVYKNQTLVETVEARIANPDEYNKILRNTLGDYSYILCMEELLINNDKRHQVCFNIDGGVGNYDVILSFSKSIVQWDEYDGKAWYEDKKWK